MGDEMSINNTDYIVIRMDRVFDLFFNYEHTNFDNHRSECDHLKLEYQLDDLGHKTALLLDAKEFLEHLGVTPDENLNENMLVDNFYERI